MRIAQVAPLFESVPPSLYGGTERVVSWLTEELVKEGHEVTLFASGDSKTQARLIAGCPEALWRDARCRETLPHTVRMMELVFSEVSQFDIIHFHTDYVQFPLIRRSGHASITTLHGMVHPHDLGDLLGEYSEVPLVSISDSQRAPLPAANWCGTVHHGLPPSVHTFRPTPGRYLAFLGRISPEKGVERAIEIAKYSGLPLKIAAKIYDEDRSYYELKIKPLLQSAASFVEFVGEVGGSAKDEFLGNALALLFPVEWPEPFGLVMIESMACGTPVIAWRRGAIPEVIEHGISGFIVESVQEAVRFIPQLSLLSRGQCRRSFEARFSSARMAHDYLKVYEQTIAAIAKQDERSLRGQIRRRKGRHNERAQAR